MVHSLSLEEGLPEVHRLSRPPLTLHAFLLLKNLKTFSKTPQQSLLRPRPTPEPFLQRMDGAAGFYCSVQDSQTLPRYSLPYFGKLQCS